jgi:hypothetical protein
MWNKTPMKPLGEANLTVKNSSTGDERIITLIVVPNGHANLLGFKTVQNTSPVLEFFTVRFASPNGFIGVLFHILSVIDVGLT